jgi:FkbM family methyltransferase
VAIFPQLRVRLVLPVVRAARIARFRDAPLRSRLRLIRLPRTRPLRRMQRVDLGRASVRFESEFDVRAFDEVFFADTYESDYRDAQVIDVGAHKGYYAAFAVLRGAAHVEAFEPAPTNARVLRATAAELDGRCTVHEVAVGAHDAEAILHLSDESWRHSLLAIPSERSVPVKVVALTTILREITGHSRVIVKIDAEGAECDITAGTPLDAWKCVDEAFVEYHRFAGCTIAQLVSRLERAGLRHAGRHAGGVFHFVREPRS